MILALIFVAGLAASCGKGKTDATDTPTATATAKADAGSQDYDPFGRFDPPINLSYSVNGTDNNTLKGDDTMNDNYWTRNVLADLGINLTCKWAVTVAMSESKWQLAYASNDLPDFIEYHFSQNSLKDLVDAGVLADLTEAYEKYASPELKAMYDREVGGVTLKANTLDGKLYGLCNYGLVDNVGDPAILWVRQDWIEKLGLPNPDTMENLAIIAEAFATQDPQGNGEYTIGLAVNQNLLYGPISGWLLGDVIPVFAGFHSYPDQWVEGSDGNLIYGGIAPEAKSALTQLQAMYKSGAIDLEFGTTDTQQIYTYCVNDQCGLIFSPPWGAEYQIGNNVANNPDAKWSCYPIPSADSQPAKVPNSNSTVNGGLGISPGEGHAEALIKMQNYFVKKWYFNFDEEDATNVAEEAFWGPLFFQPSDKNYWCYKNISQAYLTGDTSALTSEELRRYNGGLKWKNDRDVDYWGEYFQTAINPDGMTGSFDVVDKYYVPNNLYFLSPYTNLETTEGMNAYLSTLYQLQLEQYTKIIQGADVDSTWDSFVSQWNAAGGSQITQEVNDWWAENK